MQVAWFVQTWHRVQLASHGTGLLTLDLSQTYSPSTEKLETVTAWQITLQTNIYYINNTEQMSNTIDFITSSVVLITVSQLYPVFSLERTVQNLTLIVYLNLRSVVSTCSRATWSKELSVIQIRYCQSDNCMLTFHSEYLCRNSTNQTYFCVHCKYFLIKELTITHLWTS